MEPFELFAIRYAHNGPRTLGQNVIGADPHEAHSALDFYVWVAKRSDRVFLIDTGMAEETAKRKGEQFFRAPADAVQLLGIDPEKLEDVILTHMHYDHAGALHRYPKARFYLQDTEMAYATGRCMCTRLLRRGYEVEDVVHLIRCVYEDRVTFQDETVEVTSGLSVHRIGGHTNGQQVVRVWTERGWIVIASDASHLYHNMQNNAPFPSVYNVGDMAEGFKTLYRLADGSWDHVIPGHDPLVMQFYPAPAKELEGIVVRLDKPPLTNR